MVISSSEIMKINSGMQSQSSLSVPIKLVAKKEEEDKKVIEIPASKIKYHKISKHDKYKIKGIIPEDYISDVKVPKTNVENLMKLNTKFKLVTFKAPDESNEYYVKSCYIIDSIISPVMRKGEGTKAVRNVLEKSLTDKDTDGRLIVNVIILDDEITSAGFFYKLGFRFLNPTHNEIMQKWISNKDNHYMSPKLTGLMYLPKENINRLMLNKMLF